MNIKSTRRQVNRHSSPFVITSRSLGKKPASRNVNTEFKSTLGTLGKSDIKKPLKLIFSESSVSEDFEESKI